MEGQAQAGVVISRGGVGRMVRVLQNDVEPRRDETPEPGTNNPMTDETKQ